MSASNEPFLGVKARIYGYMDQSEEIGAYSIGINLLLVGIKVLLSLLSGSVALIADALHSSTDVISSITVLAGIKISRRKSKNFPYGLYKVENFVSLLSSIFIFLAGYEIVHTVFSEQQSLKIKYLPYAMGGVLLTLAITFAFSWFEMKKGREIGSPSLIADAEHIRTDMLSSLVRHPIFTLLPFGRRTVRSFQRLTSTIHLQERKKQKESRSVSGCSKKEWIQSIHLKDSKEKARVMSFRMRGWR